MDDEQAGPTIYSIGYLTIDLTTERVQHHNQDVALTLTEWHLLRCLVQHQNCVVTPDQIMTELRTEMSDVVLRKYIMQLRQKLEPNPAYPRIIRTLHGRGYRFVIPDHAV